jgi:hypothetical protein
VRRSCSAAGNSSPSARDTRGGMTEALLIALAACEVVMSGFALTTFAFD